MRISLDYEYYRIMAWPKTPVTVETAISVMFLKPDLR